MRVGPTVHWFALVFHWDYYLVRASAAKPTGVKLQLCIEQLQTP